MARLHPQELQRLLKGAEVRKEKQQRRQSSATGADPARSSKRRREQDALDKVNDRIS